MPDFCRSPTAKHAQAGPSANWQTRVPAASQPAGRPAGRAGGRAGGRGGGRVGAQARKQESKPRQAQPCQTTSG